MFSILMYKTWEKVQSFCGKKEILPKLSFFKKIFIYFFRERGREGEREGEKHQCVVASREPPTGDLACNPGMCPDWELNRQHFSSQAVLNLMSHTNQGLPKSS